MILSMEGDPERDPGVDEDGRLLVAALTQPDTFGLFYDRNNQRVLAYFYRRTFCAHTSADLCAETFAQAWTSLPRFDAGAGTGRAWLFGIAGNLYRQWLRRGVVRQRARRRLSIATPELTADDLDHIENLVDTSDLRAGLQDALDQLSPGVRDAVLMRVALDLPYERVAEGCSCSVGAARVRVARGLATLTELMERGPR
jgi:RNA polymerase sigma-70 factor (ECF subfamily)